MGWRKEAGSVFLAVLLGVAGAGGVCLGQEPAAMRGRAPVEALERWLESGRPQEVAWGAEFAERQGERTVLPDLERLAAAWRLLPHSAVARETTAEVPPLTGEEEDRYLAMRAVLDAVVQMDGRLPADAVERLEGDFPAQAAVLLARMDWREAEPVLWAIYREEPPSSHAMVAVAAAMLAEHPPEGFAASLLRGLRVGVNVRVVLVGDPGMGFGFGAGDCAGSGLGAVRKGWPAMGQYTLLANEFAEGAGKEGVVAVVRAHWPKIVVVRGEGPTTETTAVTRDVCGGPWLTDSVRATLLSEMLGMKEPAVAVEVLQQVNLRVKSRADYEAQVRAYVAGQERQFAVVIGQLRERGLLSAEEAGDAGLRPELALYLEDGRSEQHFAVERVETGFANVRWVEQRFWPGMR